MRTRTTLLGLIVCGLATTSCASIARDAVVDAYENNGVEAKACRVEAKVLSTASDAFAAENGAPPQSFEDLVPLYLDEAPPNWIVADGGVGDVADVFAALPDGPCDGIDLATPVDDDDSIGGIGIDAITGSNAFNCSYDERVLATAIETYFVLNGADPASVGDLDQFGLIDDQGERWIIEASANAGEPSVARPAPGGACDE